MQEPNINEETNIDFHKESDEHSESESKVIEYFKKEDNSKKLDFKDALSVIYQLKIIDKELAEIEEEKGDIPGKISELNNEISDLENEKSELETQSVELIEEEKKIKLEDEASEEKIYKYDEEKYSVKSNKEYDKIMLTIDSLLELVTNNETRLKEIDGLKTDINLKLESLTNQISELNTELKENKALLEELNKEHETEEVELNDKRSKLTPKLKEDVLFLYEKINGTYKGEAIAVVRKGNCSGCYNSIPPQRVLEIKSGEDIFQCQSCGRILIDESLI